MKGISPNERKVATGFIFDILMGSDSLVPQKNVDGNILVIPSPGRVLPSPFNSLEIILHTTAMPLKKFRQRQTENLERYRQTVHVFYSDNNTYNVRPEPKTREELAAGILKRHQDEMGKIFIPRIQEKYVLERTGELIYYSPKENSANDSIIVIAATPAALDHSHITPENRRPFEIDGPSKKYYIKELKAIIKYGDRIGFETSRRSAAYNIKQLPGKGTNGPAQGRLF